MKFAWTSKHRTLWLRPACSEPQTSGGHVTQRQSNQSETWDYGASSKNLLPFPVALGLWRWKPKATASCLAIMRFLDGEANMEMGCSWEIQSKISTYHSRGTLDQTIPEVNNLWDLALTRDKHFSFLVLVNLIWSFLSHATKIELASTYT